MFLFVSTDGGPLMWFSIALVAYQVYYSGGNLWSSFTLTPSSAGKPGPFGQVVLGWPWSSLFGLAAAILVAVYVVSKTLTNLNLPGWGVRKQLMWTGGFVAFALIWKALDGQVDPGVMPVVSVVCGFGLVTFLMKMVWRMDARQAAGEQREQAATQEKVNLDAVLALVRKIPTEEYESAESIKQLGASELKARLRRRGVNTDTCVQKSDLVDLFLKAQDGGSTSCTCSICFEDYVDEDVLRVLGCQHRFHLECVDQWAITACNSSREVACPVCNTPIAGTGGAAKKTQAT
jgi:hypothetical protein